MPAASIDTFFACSLMTLLVLTAMVGLSTTLFPYVEESTESNFEERCLQLAKHIILTAGYPSNWGENATVILQSFGLAEEGEAYALNVDKVSRLNPENAYALSYVEILDCLKVSDVVFQISVKPVFNIQVNMTSYYEAENETIYTFEINITKYGLPIPVFVKYYIVTEGYVDSNPPFVLENGQGVFNFSVSNSLDGEVALIVLAKHVFNSKIVSAATYSFYHNSEDSSANNVFTQLSPLNYTLNVAPLYSSVNLSKAYVFTFNYLYELEKLHESEQLVQFAVPRLLDVSPLLLAVTGQNSTTSFVDCVSYPHVPLEIGASFTNPTTKSNVVVHQQIVTINRVLYEFTMLCGGPSQ